MYTVAVMQDKAGVDQAIYGTKIIPLLPIKTATQKTTIRAGTICKSFIETPYRRTEIVHVRNRTIPSADATDQDFPIQFRTGPKFVAYRTV
jgi:hypothetical protein